jgi:hypothetical protein
MLLAAAVVEDGLDWSRDGRQRPDPDGPDDAFEDRSVQIGTTFGGTGVIRGNLTPECAAAVRALLEALGKKADPGDDRTEDKRFHDALQMACALLPRVHGPTVLPGGMRRCARMRKTGTLDCGKRVLKGAGNRYSDSRE